MSEDGYAVPEVLRGARFVRRQPGTRRAPMRVTPRAFELAGMPVPEDRRELNIYRLTERRGEPWSPALDRHVARFGAELLGERDLINIDTDTHLAVDGTVWLDGFRWLTDAGAAVGELLDITMFVAVRTPGDPDRNHGPGWHLWARADPEYPVKLGPLKRCPAVEIKDRCTAPGSAGYEVRHAPAGLPVIPRWIAELAGHPLPPPAIRPGLVSSPARAMRRLQWAIADLLEPHALRNNCLYKAGLRAGEAGLGEARAVELLMPVAAEAGLVAEDGEARCADTIRRGARGGAASRQAVARA
jgi:hypothetical protein